MDSLSSQIQLAQDRLASLNPNPSPTAPSTFVQETSFFRMDNFWMWALLIVFLLGGGFLLYKWYKQKQVQVKNN
jgi:hypothetical protein